MFGQEDESFSQSNWYLLWGVGVQDHFLTIPVVFAATSGPSFTEAERGVWERGAGLIFLVSDR